MNELKKYYLTLVLDAYVTKNAIEEFLDKEDSIQAREMLIARGRSPEYADTKVKKYLNDLYTELSNIEFFLNDKDGYHWIALGQNRDFFDETLPKHKRKLKWFHSIDRYPFDHSIFYIPKVR